VLAGAASGFIASGGDLKSTMISTMTAAAFAAVGRIDFGKGFEASLAQSAAHGFVGGFSAVASGGDFVSGFLTAGVAKFATTQTRGMEPVSRGIIAMVVGGTVSQLTGGKFANGASTAAMGYLFNEFGTSLQRGYGHSLTHWPVPGHYELNTANRPGEGEGYFGAFRSGGRLHTGIDIQAPEGASVVSAGSGTIVGITPNPSSTYGTQIVIDHGHIHTQYSHLQSSFVKAGQTVSGGELIGTVGRTGNVPPQGDAHLHFEVRRGSSRPVIAGGRVDDPLQYLPR
jgi:murein DD-endopeptidase MepM/ murein hydrolase activator NlpD